MVFVVILCKLGWTSVSSIVTSIMMLMIAATSLQISMDIFFIDIINKFYLLLIEFLQHASVLDRKTKLLELVQVFNRPLVCLLDISCLHQVDEELLDEVDRGRLREQKVGVDKDNVVGKIF